MLFSNDSMLFYTASLRCAQISVPLVLDEAVCTQATWDWKSYIAFAYMDNSILQVTHPCKYSNYSSDALSAFLTVLPGLA